MVAYKDAVYSAICSSQIKGSPKGVGIGKIRKLVGEHDGLKAGSKLITTILQNGLNDGMLVHPTQMTWRFAPGKTPK